MYDKYFFPFFLLCVCVCVLKQHAYQSNTIVKGMEEMCMLTYSTISLFGNYIMDKWPA